MQRGPLKTYGGWTRPAVTVSAGKRRATEYEARKMGHLIGNVACDRTEALLAGTGPTVGFISTRCRVQVTAQNKSILLAV